MKGVPLHKVVPCPKGDTPVRHTFENCERYLTALVAFTLVCAYSVRGQGSQEPPADKELVQQLLKRISDLEASQKLTQENLEKMSVAAAPAPEVTPPPVTEAAPEAPPETPVTHVLGPVQFNGFSDVNYGRAWFEKLPPAGL